MLDARSDRSVGLISKRPFKAMISFITLVAFLANTICYDIAWAGRTPSELTSVGSDKRAASPASTGALKQLTVKTFSLPRSLGTVKDSWEPAIGSRKTGTTVIHIQDAHCNYYAQRAIADIIEYLNKEYGVSEINLEGGAKDYDLSIFTGIKDRAKRERVADHFVKEGLVNGAEYFALNNPDKARLWGIEDTRLYIDNLKVYRNSLKDKDDVDRLLKNLSHILTNLKMKIYSKELLSLDLKYTQYKAGNIEFKDYLNYLAANSRDKLIDIKSFPDIFLLNQVMKREDEIDFRKANNERDELIDRLQKRLSKNGMKELVVKTVEFKAGITPQEEFYGYLVNKAKQADIPVGNFPELEKYIVYISSYAAVDKSKVIDEVGALETKIREVLYQNDKQRQLDKLSKDLAILKNIFNISLTRADYRYYKANEGAFAIRNYTSFINKEASLLEPVSSESIAGMKQVQDLYRLDGYRGRIEKFYEYSFKRDNAFIKNMTLEPVSRKQSNSMKQVQKSSIVVTGGFHTENLTEQFKEKNIAYISIIPNFRTCDGYECPYFKILSGEKNIWIRDAMPSVLKSSMATAAQLCPTMTEAMIGAGLKAPPAKPDRGSSSGSDEISDLAQKPELAEDGTGLPIVTHEEGTVSRWEYLKNMVSGKITNEQEKIVSEEAVEVVNIFLPDEEAEQKQAIALELVKKVKPLNLFYHIKHVLREDAMISIFIAPFLTIAYLAITLYINPSATGVVENIIFSFYIPLIGAATLYGLFDSMETTRMGGSSYLGYGSRFPIIAKYFSLLFERTPNIFLSTLGSDRRFRLAVAHEFTHLMKRMGHIKHDIDYPIASAMGVMRVLEKEHNVDIAAGSMGEWRKEAFEYGYNVMKDNDVGLEIKYERIEEWAKGRWGSYNSVEPEYTYGLGVALVGMGYALSQQTGRPEDLRQFIYRISQITGKKSHSEEVADVIKEITGGVVYLTAPSAEGPTAEFIGAIRALRPDISERAIVDIYEVWHKLGEGKEVKEILRALDEIHDDSGGLKKAFPDEDLSFVPASLKNINSRDLIDEAVGKRFILPVSSLSETAREVLRLFNIDSANPNIYLIPMRANPSANLMHNRAVHTKFTKNGKPCSDVFKGVGIADRMEYRTVDGVRIPFYKGKPPYGLRGGVLTLENMTYLGASWWLKNKFNEYFDTNDAIFDKLKARGLKHEAEDMIIQPGAIFKPLFLSATFDPRHAGEIWEGAKKGIPVTDVTRLVEAETALEHVGFSKTDDREIIEGQEVLFYQVGISERIEELSLVGDIRSHHSWRTADSRWDSFFEYLDPTLKRENPADRRKLFNEMIVRNLALLRILWKESFSASHQYGTIVNHQNLNPLFIFDYDSIGKGSAEARASDIAALLNTLSVVAYALGIWPHPEPIYRLLVTGDGNFVEFDPSLRMLPEFQFAINTLREMDEDAFSAFLEGKLLQSGPSATNSEAELFALPIGSFPNDFMGETPSAAAKPKGQGEAPSPKILNHVAHATSLSAFEKILREGLYQRVGKSTLSDCSREPYVASRGDTDRVEVVFDIPIEERLIKTSSGYDTGDYYEMTKSAQVILDDKKLDALFPPDSISSKILNGMMKDANRAGLLACLPNKYINYVETINRIKFRYLETKKDAAYGLSEENFIKALDLIMEMCANDTIGNELSVELCRKIATDYEIPDKSREKAESILAKISTLTKVAGKIPLAAVPAAAKPEQSSTPAAGVAPQGPSPIIHNQRRQFIKSAAIAIGSVIAGGTIAYITGRKTQKKQSPAATEAISSDLIIHKDEETVKRILKVLRMSLRKPGELVASMYKKDIEASIDRSNSNVALIEEAYDRLEGFSILDAGIERYPVLLITNTEKMELRSFDGSADSELDLIIINYDRFMDLREKYGERRAMIWLVETMAHEWTHLNNKLVRPGISELKDEFWAYWATWKAVSKLEPENEASIKYANDVYKTFDILVKNRSKVCKILNVKDAEFNDISYVNVFRYKKELMAITLYDRLNPSAEPITLFINISSNSIKEPEAPGKNNLSPEEQKEIDKILKLSATTLDLNGSRPLSTAVAAAFIAAAAKPEQPSTPAAGVAPQGPSPIIQVGGLTISAPSSEPFLKKYSPYLYIYSTIVATLLMSAAFATFIDWSKSNIFIAALNVFFMAILNYNIVEGIATKALSFTHPLILPGVDLKSGIPPEYKTISYYPILLRSESELKFFDEDFIPSIENNNDPNIKWVVFSSSPDGIRELERDRVLELQKKYGQDRVFYIHRDSSINNWEKKRGGYMHFMLWLKNSLRADGTLDSDPRFPACPAGKVFDEILGDISGLKGANNLAMADSDTIWTKDSIKGLVSKIEHPSNREYGIFQSRVEPYNTEESVLTKYSYHIFKKYRDRGARVWRALRQVNFIGHGAAWNIDTFLNAIAGKMKDGYLSHDIVEGIFLKTALTEDIVTLEEIPPNIFLQIKQWARWWKGNKLSFVFFKREVPDESGKLVKNKATLINKYLLYIATKNYLSSPMLLALILTNMVFSHYIFYGSLSLLTVLYGILISFELYGSALIGNGSVGDTYKSIKSLTMFIMLAPVNVVEVSIFVIKSYIDDIKNEIRQNKKMLVWVPQGGLTKELTLKQSYSNLKYVMLFAIVTLSIYHNYMGMGLYYFFGALIISPLLAWYTSLAPPAITPPSAAVKPEQPSTPAAGVAPQGSSPIIQGSAISVNEVFALTQEEYAKAKAILLGEKSLSLKEFRELVKDLRNSEILEHYFFGGPYAAPHGEVTPYLKRVYKTMFTAYGSAALQTNNIVLIAWVIRKFMELVPKQLYGRGVDPYTKIPYSEAIKEKLATIFGRLLTGVKDASLKETFLKAMITRATEGSTIAADYEVPSIDFISISVIMQNNRFQRCVSSVANNKPAASFIIAQNVLRHMTESYMLLTDDEINNAVEYVEKQFQENRNRGILGGRTEKMIIARHAEDMFADEEAIWLGMAKRTGVKDEIITKDLIGPQSKNDILKHLEDAVGVTTFIFNGHGGKNHLWLSQGEPSQAQRKEMHITNAISYIEMAEALAKNAKTNKVFSDMNIILLSCFSNDFAIQLRNELRKLLGASIKLPLIYAASDENATARSGAISRAIDKNIQDVLTVQNLFEVSDDPSVFVTNNPSFILPDLGPVMSSPTVAPAAVKPEQPSTPAAGVAPQGPSPITGSAVTAWFDRITPRMQKRMKALFAAPLLEESLYRLIPVFITGVITYFVFGEFDWNLALALSTPLQAAFGYKFITDHLEQGRAPPSYARKLAAPTIVTAINGIILPFIMPIVTANPIAYICAIILTHSITNAIVLIHNKLITDKSKELGLARKIDERSIYNAIHEGIYFDDKINRIYKILLDMNLKEQFQKIISKEMDPLVGRPPFGVNKNLNIENVLDLLVQDFIRIIGIRKVPGGLENELKEMLRTRFFVDMRDLAKFEEVTLNQYEAVVLGILAEYNLSADFPERIKPVLVRLGKWSVNFGIVDVTDFKEVPPLDHAPVIGIATRALAGLGDITKIGLLVPGIAKEMSNMGVEKYTIRVFCFQEDMAKMANLEAESASKKAELEGMYSGLTFEFIPITGRNARIKPGSKELENMDVLITLVRPVNEVLSLPAVETDISRKGIPPICMTLGEYDSMVPPNERRRSVSLFEIKTGFADDSIGFFINPYTEELYNRLQNMPEGERVEERGALLVDTIIEIMIERHKSIYREDYRMSHSGLDPPEEEVATELERAEMEFRAGMEEAPVPAISELKQSKQRWGVIYMHHEGIRYLRALALHQTRRGNLQEPITIFTFFGDKNRERNDLDEFKELKEKAGQDGLDIAFYDISDDPTQITAIPGLGKPGIRVINLGMRTLDCNIRYMAYSDLPIGTTGDESLLTALTLRKPTFYEAMSWKMTLFRTLLDKLDKLENGQGPAGRMLETFYQANVYNADTYNILESAFNAESPVKKPFKDLGDLAAAGKLYPGLVPRLILYIRVIKFFDDLAKKYPLDEGILGHRSFIGMYDGITSHSEKIKLDLAVAAISQKKLPFKIYDMPDFDIKPFMDKMLSAKFVVPEAKPMNIIKPLAVSVKEELSSYLKDIGIFIPLIYISKLALRLKSFFPKRTPYGLAGIIVGTGIVSSAICMGISDTINGPTAMLLLLTGVLAWRVIAMVAMRYAAFLASIRNTVSMAGSRTEEEIANRFNPTKRPNVVIVNNIEDMGRAEFHSRIAARLDPATASRATVQFDYGYWCDGHYLYINNRTDERGAPDRNIYVNNAMYDAIPNTLYLHTNAAGSSYFRLGVVPAHEKGKMFFLRSKLGQKLSGTDRISRSLSMAIAELCGDFAEAFYLMTSWMRPSTYGRGNMSDWLPSIPIGVSSAPLTIFIIPTALTNILSFTYMGRFLMNEVIRAWEFMTYEILLIRDIIAITY
ncbi:MAG: hypothetical protein PHI58_02250, partial [Candidatus Omnitrophica bacterium]|nr:hypothetical protein [Candidatus Omnitrophota bacterium]